MKTISPEQEFRTKDFYGAALLATAGLKLDRLERGMNDFVTFVFSDPSFTAEEILGRYWNGDIKLNAKELITNIRELKTRVHQKMA